MGFLTVYQAAVRYRGFLLLPQINQRWLVRPERSPMVLLPFRTPTCSLADVKALLDLRLSQHDAETRNLTQAAAGGGVGSPTG